MLTSQLLCPFDPHSIRLYRYILIEKLQKVTTKRLNVTFCNLSVTFYPYERNKNNILLRWGCIPCGAVRADISGVFRGAMWV